MSILNTFSVMKGPTSQPQFQQASLTYRRDIDGLRALAVLPVVFFHAGIPGFRGGFVGVDIFFVISGYLITSIIVDAMEKKNFSLTWFYERRVRRIVPALIAMVAVATLASLILLPPKSLAEFGESLASSAGFASNFYFAQHSSYFVSKLRPLLHTWSLGVEEQFYIAWPLILLACRRAGLRAIKIIVVTIIIASLAYSIASQATTTSARVSFYLPQARAWELMVGATLSLGMAPKIKSRIFREGLAWLGFSALAAAITQFSAATAFPGFWALVPCVGAALILYTGECGPTSISKMVSLSPCVFVGLISYSLYLWHWPIFNFGRYVIGHPLHSSESAGLIITSLVIASASWRYVEQPFRFHKSAFQFSRKSYLIGGCSALAAFAIVGIALHLTDGLPRRLSQTARRFALASRENNPLQVHCHTETPYPQPASKCTVPAIRANGAYDVIVWGDSIADAFFPGVAVVAESKGLSVRQATSSGCLPLLGVNRVDLRPNGFSTHDCAQFNRRLLKELRVGPRPRVALLTGRWSMYASGSRPAAFLVTKKDSTPNVVTSRLVLAEGLEKTTDALKALGISVVLVDELPEFRENPNECFVRRSIFHQPTDDCVRIARVAADQRLKASRRILVKVAQEREDVHYFDLEPFLCDDQWCRATRGNMPLYRDQDHLSLTGARRVGSDIVRAGQLGALLAH